MLVNPSIMTQVFGPHKWCNPAPQTNTDKECRNTEEFLPDVERWWRRMQEQEELNDSEGHPISSGGAPESQQPINWSVSADSVYIIWQARSLTLCWSFMPPPLWLVLLNYSSSTSGIILLWFLTKISRPVLMYAPHPSGSACVCCALHTLDGCVVFPAECLAQ